MSTYLITGSSRGLGLALVKALSYRPASQVKAIFATARSPQPSDDLQSVINSTPADQRVKYIQLDTTDPASISTAVAETKTHLGASGLDILINNAAIQYPDTDGTRAMLNLQSTLISNVVAVHNVSTAFLPLLQQGQTKKIINISSSLGSMTLASEYAFAPVSSYKISKAALNMLTVQYAIDLRQEGFTVVALSPGNLRTEIGGQGAGMSADQGAERVLEVVDDVKFEKDNGRFRDIFVEGSEVYRGGEIPW